MSNPWILRHDSGPDAPDTGGAPQRPSTEPAWYAGRQPVAPRPPAGNGLAIAGMTLGIVSLLTWWTGLLALVLIVLSIVFSSVGIRNANLGGPHKGMAIAGLVCGIAGALGYLTVGVASAGVGFIL